MKSFIVYSLLWLAFCCLAKETDGQEELSDSSLPRSMRLWPFSSIIRNLLLQYVEERYLYQQGPYTVFLPENFIHKQGQVAVMGYLLKLVHNPRDFGMHFYSLLNYQISDQHFDSHLLSNSSMMEMLNGDEINVSQLDSTILLQHAGNEPAEVMSEAPYEEADGKTIVYLTDRFLIPDWMTLDPMDYMNSIDGEFTVFYELLVAAEMESLFRRSSSSNDDFSLLVPINEAFPPRLAASLVEHPDGLRKFLQYHMFAKVLNIRSLNVGIHTEGTVQGESVSVRVTGKRGIVFNQASLKGFQLTRNGVLYRIDGVLIPPSWSSP